MTSVEFIISNMQSPEWEYTPWAKRKLIIEHAKEMHRQEIQETWDQGRFNIDAIGSGEEYYNETFKR